MEHVSLEFMACHLCFDLFVSSRLGLFFVVIEDGTLAVNTIVLCPRSQTKPAELMMANSAVHHVAT